MEHLSKLVKIIWLQTIVIVLLLVVVIVCLVAFQKQHSTSLDINRLTVFQRSINDAAVVDESRIVRNLFALNTKNNKLIYEQRDNKNHVKAVAWMSEHSYRKNYAAQQGDCSINSESCTYIDKPQGLSPAIDIAQLWITLVPQVRAFCQQLAVEDPSFRIKQYLGLNPNRRYQRFIEIWVEPTNVFRPCIDPDPTDNACELIADPNNLPLVSGISDYLSFFNGLTQVSYTPTGAPWTKLGYTYDWAYGERGVGASEYMLVPNSDFYIEKSYTTDEYCSTP